MNSFFKQLKIIQNLHSFRVNDTFAALKCAARLGPKAVSDEIGAGSSAEVGLLGRVVFTAGDFMNTRHLGN